MRVHPKSVTSPLGPVEGQIVLTPVRRRGDRLRAKLAELKLTDADIGDAVASVRAEAFRKTLTTPRRKK